jgi:hypothetical protein
VRPDAFAAVMATGIVSLAAADHGFDVVSWPLAALALLGLPVLMYLSAVAWRRDSWSLADLDTAVGLLTYVAACCVLVGRFSWSPAAVWILGPLALGGWASLMPAVLRGLWRLRWTGLRDRAHGGWELASVATSGLAIVFVAGGTLFWGLIFWVLALLLYLAMTALVVWRGVWRDVPPDHWIVMGGSAIATLAGEHVHAALYPGPIADAVRAVNIATWALATAWIVPLAVIGWRRIRDWPAVFPLGMYSAATYAVSVETGWSVLSDVSLAFLGIALAVWLLTGLRLLGGSRRAPAGGAPSDPAR